jgi:hypothetical protein
MNFKVYGPFAMPRTPRGFITTAPERKNEFWEEVEETEDGLSWACGCYIFTIYPRGGGAKPWYVGLASRQSFRSECFQPSKIIAYNKALESYGAASPQLFLIAKLTASENFSQPSSNGYKDIEVLEDILIGIAYARNPELVNIHGTTFLKNTVIPGVMNTPQGYPGAAAMELRSLLGL